MEIVAASPRRILSASERRQRDDRYRVTLAEFGGVLKEIVKLSNALNILTAALCKAGKGAYVEVPDPAIQNNVYPFNRRNLRSSQALLHKKILELKNYLRVSKKKTRDQVRPESFSGTYTPVYAGDALQYFFQQGANGFGTLSPYYEAVAENDRDELIRQKLQMLNQAIENLNATNPEDKDAYNNALSNYESLKNYELAQYNANGDINIIAANLSRNLFDYLPQASQGYLLRNTSTMLFYIYAHANNLQERNNAQYARSNEIMDAAFGGNIPATFLSYRAANGKTAKVLMERAVQENIIAGPMNTYQVISSMYPVGTLNKKGDDVGFTSERFNTYYYQNIAAANYRSRANLAEDPQLAASSQHINSDAVLREMLDEHNLVKSVSEEWHEILEPSRKQQRDERKKQKDAAKRVPKASK